MKYLTLALLEKKGACKEERDVFHNLYPEDSVLPTPDECEKVAHIFSFYWAAQNLLTKKQRAQYNTRTHRAHVQYMKEAEPFLEQRDRATAPAHEAFLAVRRPLLEAHRKRCEELRQEYLKQEVRADWFEYSEKCNAWYREYTRCIEPAEAMLRLLREPFEAQCARDVKPAQDRLIVAEARAFGEVWCS